MKVLLKDILPIFKPYFIVTITALTAYLPVSLMIFSLKNDIVALDYPIKYFISECLHHNVQPFWFNTWAMGFPLESVITWSFFSPLQFLFGVLFKYNPYTLHAEFIFYVTLAGCSMFHLLKRHVSNNKDLVLLTSICYMLSGFTIGSSQWMTYLTAAAFLPLILSSFISLLKSPSGKTSAIFVALYYIMLTSVYPAFTIITSYLLISILMVYIVKNWTTVKYLPNRNRLLITLAATFILMLFLYAPSLISSFQVLENIDRGRPLSTNDSFFDSNYLHPIGLTTLLFPLSSTQLTAPNTEGTMLHCYVGLLPLLLLPMSILKNIAEKRWLNWLVLSSAFVFLLLSFGGLTSLRHSINVLPGFAYFRNPALFRLFFILVILIYLNKTFCRDDLWQSIKGTPAIKATKPTFLVLLAISSVVAMSKIDSLKSLFHYTSIKEFVRHLNLNDALFISAVLQTILLCLAYFLIKKYKTNFLKILLVSDLIINGLLCTPFFTVSSYSVKFVNKIFQSTTGFPVQIKKLENVATSFHLNGANWYNINIYKKEVSARPSYFGPLVLKDFSKTRPENFFYNKPLMFSSNPKTRVTISSQRPNAVQAFVDAKEATAIYFQQNFYPNWHAYFNDKEVKIDNVLGQMKTTVNGRGKLEFRYERSSLYIIAIIINMSMLLTIIYSAGARFLKTFRNIYLQNSQSSLGT